MEDWNTPLTESKNFKIVNQYEAVKLIFKHDKTKPTITIGDFYGDPTCAMISANEKYVVMGGCGLVVYFLHAPYESYIYNKITPQYFELFRVPDNIWWVETIYQADIDNLDGEWNIFKFVAQEETGEGIYQMDLATRTVTRITGSSRSNLA